MSGPARRWGPWLALVLVLGVALVIGATREAEHQSISQRTIAIAGQVRCPVCQGESAAQSNTPAAQGIRNTIQAGLTRGESSGQIIRSLENDYGTTILESPPASGFTLWAWLIPVAVAAAAVVGLALGFRHWRRRPAGGRPSGATAPGGPPGVTLDDEALVREALAHRNQTGGYR